MNAQIQIVHYYEKGGEMSILIDSFLCKDFSTSQWTFDTVTKKKKERCTVDDSLPN